jgi:uncharacterized protein YrrD
MRRGKSVIGKDVLSFQEGVKIDTVNDVVIDPNGRSLVALVVDEGGFLSSSRIVPVADVNSFGRDAVVVPSRESVVSAGDYPAVRDLVDRDEKLIGKVVYTVEGNKLGSVSDIFFDEHTGDIAGYEVSGGLIGDMARGTSYLSASEVANIGPDLVYVQPELEQALEGQVGGLQGAVGRAGERIGAVRDEAGQRVGKARETVAERAAEAKPEERLVGRMTGTDVEADDGEVLVPRGRRIRQEDVERVRERGKLGALVAAVTTADAERAAADARHAGRRQRGQSLGPVHAGDHRDDRLDRPPARRLAHQAAAG